MPLHFISRDNISVFHIHGGSCWNRGR